MRIKIFADGSKYMEYDYPSCGLPAITNIRTGQTWLYMSTAYVFNEGYNIRLVSFTKDVTDGTWNTPWVKSSRVHSYGLGKKDCIDYLPSLDAGELRAKNNAREAIYRMEKE